MQNLLKITSTNIYKIPYRNASALNRLKIHLDEQLESIREAGTYKKERIITSKQGPYIRVAGRNNDILNFCANNYLGLSVSNFIYSYF